MLKIVLKNTNMSLRSGKMTGIDYPKIDYNEASRNKGNLINDCYEYKP